MNLRQKIGLGFLIVLALHIAVAVMGWLGQERAREDRVALAAGNALTRQMLAIDRLVGDLQGSVQGYTFSGNRGLALRSEQTYATLSRAIAAVRERLAGDDRDDIDGIVAALLRYRGNFEAAVEDRTRRERLVQRELPALSREAARLTEEQIARFSEGSQLAQDLRDLHRDFVAAEKGALQYLAQLDSHAVGAARTAIAAVRQRLARSVGFEPGFRRAFADICQRFDDVLFGLVQSTRSYLHLVHVVMAAEAVEVLRASERMRNRALDQLEVLEAHIEQQQDEYQAWSSAVSIATIVLGIAAGMVIGRIVVRPLRAITGTLQRLTRGEHVPVPALQRNDEIGDIAAAALALRERNQDTERLMRDRERMIAELRRSNEDLDEFAHLASHDLKAPLCGVSTICRWLEQDCSAELPEVGRAHLARLRETVRRMARLLDDLLDYARVRRADADLQEVDVVTVVREVIELVEADGVSLRLCAPEYLLRRVAALPLRQVLANLVANAVEHHDRDCGEIVVELAADGAAVVLTITDDGPGIPVEFHKRVFEPFESLAPAAGRPRRSGRGSGIGLAIVARLALRYHATVQLESPVAHGRGSRFRVIWPAEAVARGDQQLAAVDAMQ